VLKDDWVTTVILKSNGEYSNDERKKVLREIINRVVKEAKGDGVILFPGGYYSTGTKEASTIFDAVEREVSSELRKIEKNIIICIGIDGKVKDGKLTGYAEDQLAVAISKQGIIAIGRKFHPAPGEKGHVRLASDYQSIEEGKRRIFTLNEKRYFLCACYDSFGIRKKSLSNPGVDIILDLVHGFCRRGEGPSGHYYFARDGFARASEQWRCPVFGAAVFFNRKVASWPSGVLQKSKVGMTWKYEDNPLKWAKSLDLKIPEGKALIRIYALRMT